MIDTADTPLLGHGSQIARFISAVQSQRLHHAWLLTGPCGIGKALFAWQASAYMLHHAFEDNDFSHALRGSAATQMRAGSHPDFRYVSPDPKKAKAIISVEQIREMSSMYVTTAGMGGWRLAIIDAADDMNRNAANALLKLLEEPPEKSLFFLVSHAPGRLLPTIRSRCQVLRFHPLDEAETRSVVARCHGDVDPVELDAVLALAQGAPGRAVELLETNAADYLLTIHDLFNDLSKFDHKAILGLADALGDRTASPAFDTVWELIDERITFAVKAIATGQQDAAWIHAIDQKDWIALQQSLATRKAEASGLNLSPRQIVLRLFADIERMTRETAHKNTAY